MTTASKSFAVFDGDSHVVEPRELWEKYLEPEYRVPGKLALWRGEGNNGAHLKGNGQEVQERENEHNPRPATPPPGATRGADRAERPHTHPPPPHTAAVAHAR